MVQRYRQLTILMLMLCSTIFAATQELGAVDLPDHLGQHGRISLITIDPGQMPYAVFGHSLLRIEDPDQGLDVSVNFGVYDPSEKNFLYRVLMGTAHYRMLITDSYSQISFYSLYLNKGMIEQELKLDAAAAQRILAKLKSYGDDYSYPYDFFFDNCATRLRDLIELGIGQEIMPEGMMSGMSFRSLVDTHTFARYTLYDGVYDLLLGRLGERDASMREAEFLPIVLARSVKASGLAQDTVVLFEPVPEAERYYQEFIFPDWLMNGAIWGLVFAMLSLWVALRLWWGKGRLRLSRSVLTLVLIGFALLSALVWVLYLWSHHPQAKGNMNLIWLLPLHLAIVPYLWSARLRASKLGQVIRGYILLWMLIALFAVFLQELILGQPLPVESVFYIFGIWVMLGGFLLGQR